MFEAAAGTVSLDSIPLFWQNIQTGYLINSLALLAIILIIRIFAIRSIKRKSLVLSKDQRLWIGRIRTTTLIILFIGLALIWAPHLHTFALSLAAFAVALVIALKEMILCLMGAFVRVTTHPFRISDWITIEGITGEVIDINAFSITVQEIDIKGGSYLFTGRTIQLPNSKYFTAAIENANFNKEYIYTDFKITIAYDEYDLQELQDALVLIADRHFSPFRERAYAFRRKVESRAMIDLPEPEPSIFIRKPNANEIEFKVRAFIPTNEVETFAHRITREFMTRLKDIRTGMKVKKSGK